MNAYVEVTSESVMQFYYDKAQMSVCAFSDSGLDIPTPKNHIIPAGALSYKIPLGVRVQVRKGTTGEPAASLLVPRSSTGSKTTLRLANSVGVIDAGYTGELAAIVDNVSNTDAVHIQEGQRLFQLILPELIPPKVHIVDSIHAFVDDTNHRQDCGFGSTGN